MTKEEEKSSLDPEILRYRIECLEYEIYMLKEFLKDRFNLS